MTKQGVKRQSVVLLEPGALVIDAEHSDQAAHRSLGDALHLALQELADQHRSDRAQVEAIARSSYWHPNGYLKIQLASSGEERLRLHRWVGGASVEDPHDHRWDYTSIVLGGRLSETRYRETDGSMGDVRYEEVSFASQGPSSAVRRTGTFKYLRPESRELTTGSVVRASRTIIHSVAARSDCISALVTSAPSAAESTIYVADEEWRARHGHPASIADVEETIAELRRCL